MQPSLTVQTDTTDNKDIHGKVLPARKRKFPLSFLLVAIAVLGAIIYLVYANTQANAVYYMTVSELKHCTTCKAQSVRVAGYVESGSIQHNEQDKSISFVIKDSGQTLPVSYKGIVPDIFAPGVQVVVEGHYSGEGAFQAQTLLAKCPSKFQSATPAAGQSVK